jgi:predicted DNA-binding transcriptional regulator AlpA
MTDPSSSSPPLALSLRDFIRTVPISRSGAYNLIREGKLKAVKIGGRTVIPYAEAQRLISEGA